MNSFPLDLFLGSAPEEPLFGMLTFCEEQNMHDMFGDGSNTALSVVSVLL